MQTDKYILVADGDFVTAKQIGEVQIKIPDDSGKSFIATLYNVLFAPYLWNQFFSIII